MERTAFFVSDRTGITVEALGRSLLAQFDTIRFTIISQRFIDTLEKADATVTLINQTAKETECKPIVFSTLINPDIRERIAAGQCVFFDLMDRFVQSLENEFKIKSSRNIGRTHGLHDYTKYHLRMDAVNFALVTDDGMATDNYEHADIVIVGASRTGKTPTCLYLALTFGIYAANFPLTEEDLDAGKLPAALSRHRDKLYGLSIDPKRLHQIRTERRSGSKYASLKQCDYEIRQTEALYRRMGVAYLDTSSISVEEIATIILQHAHITRRRS